MDNLNIVEKSKLNFVARIGNRLPKWLRIIYNIVIFASLIYILIWLIAKLLIAIQKIGYTIFSPNFYWPIVTSLFILLIGAFLLAQFVFGLDPIGNLSYWIESQITLLETGYL